MTDVVFISDLHLHPDDKAIEERFNQFLAWAKEAAVKKIYILGDFFHAWAGDDGLDEWSSSIALRLKELANNNIQLFFMRGNRDFLLGKLFADLAGWTVLNDPEVIELGGVRIVLAHGDAYCTKDKAHQRFRSITRNRLFMWVFLHLPLKLRLKLINRVRNISQESNKSLEQMDVTEGVIMDELIQQDSCIMIHGHTHKPGLTSYEHEGQHLKRYVLSDWDDNPVFLCYDSTIGIRFNQL